MKNVAPSTLVCSSSDTRNSSSGARLRLAFLAIGLAAAACGGADVQAATSGEAKRKSPAELSPPPGNTEEPEYGGHLLSYWLQDLEILSSRFPTPLTKEAKTAVERIGTNAIPFLLRWMCEANSRRVGDNGVIEAFKVLGPIASCAIPALEQMVTNNPSWVLNPVRDDKGGVSMSGIPYNPLLALGHIGPDALPVLTNIIVCCSAPGIRLGAIDAIAGMGTNGLPAVSVLLACLHDSNGMINVSAFNALRFLTPSVSSNDVVLPLAAEALGAKDENRRLWAIRLLWGAAQRAGLRTQDYPYLRHVTPQPRRFTIDPKALEAATNILRTLAPELLEKHS